MKILYLSCHRPLEFDEVKLFIELGHDIDVISNYGIVEDDLEKHVIQRDKIANILYDVTGSCSPTDLYINLEIDKYDVIYIMHHAEWMAQNWLKIKHKIVILRTFQSAYQPIDLLADFRNEGLILVRYSPLTEYSSYINPADAVIRFYKDESEFNDWNGNDLSLITICNNIVDRPEYCHLDVYNKISKLFNRKLYGRGNASLNIYGGKVDYLSLKAAYRDSRVVLNLGTYPGPYTLSFIEAFITGTPIVAIGKKLCNDPNIEIPSFIENGKTGFCSDDVDELIYNIRELMNNDVLAKTISENARARAISLFGKKTIKKQWEDFFSTIG